MLSLTAVAVTTAVVVTVTATAVAAAAATSADVAVAAVADAVAVVADVAFAAEVSVTTAVVVVQLIPPRRPCLGHAMTNWAGRTAQLKTLSAADHYLRPDGPPLTLLLVGAMQHAACASGVGEGGGGRAI